MVIKWVKVNYHKVLRECLMEWKIKSLGKFRNISIQQNNKSFNNLALFMEHNISNKIKLLKLPKEVKLILMDVHKIQELN